MWWKEAVFYELYMPSFKDGNGDGIGDFRGITEKLDYLNELGIDAIWLTPFYKSPKVDNGYDISDYYSVDPDFGTMKDFENFLSEAHKRSIRVVADMVFNHSSTQCQWFIESRSSKDNPRRNWYVWRKTIPNNWESFFSGPAWEYDMATGEYYLHKFAIEQADLNWTNPEVRNELKNVMKFWLEKGLDGFRLDVLNFMNTGGNYDIDNPTGDNGCQKHLYDINQSGIHEAISELSVYAKTFGDKVMIGELGGCTVDKLKSYIGDKMLDFAFCFNFSNFLKVDVEKIYTELVKMKDKIPATLFFSNHDMERYISRFGECERDIGKAKAAAALTILAKGNPFIYYGDEIGMTSSKASTLEDINDVEGRNNYATERRKGRSHEEALAVANEKSRDKARTPMQWDSGSNAGFTAGTSAWLKVNGNYIVVNVENERKTSGSLFNFYKKIIRLRKSEKALSSGDYTFLSRKGELIYFGRKSDDTEIIVQINFGDKALNEFNGSAYKVLFGENTEFLEKNAVLVLKKCNGGLGCEKED